MTDHLEPFRRMVRSMRFVPPLPLHHDPSSWTEPTIIPSPGYPASSLTSEAETKVTGPAPDPTEYAAALVREAVSKPTILPTRYEILENIGDRIARMGPKTSAKMPIVLPKLPQPDPNWVPPPPPAPVVEELVSQETEAVEPVLEATLEAVADPVVEPVSPPDPPASEVVKAVEVAVPEAVEGTPEEAPVMEAAEAIVESVASEVAPPPEDVSTAPVEETPAVPTTVVLDQVAPEDTPVEAASSTKVGVICPHCGSGEIIKNGHYKERQRYACKDCGKSFVGNETEENPQPTPSVTEAEPVKAGNNGSSSSKKSAKSASRSSKKSAKGFGGGKSKKK